MNKKLQLVILCGGQSAEHEVSILSAKNVIKALDVKKYDLLVVYINKNGAWFLFDSPSTFINSENPETLLTTNHCQQVTFVLGTEKMMMTLTNEPQRFAVDIVFPVLHGAHGEDGTVQGLLELVNIPYVGPGVLSTAICMDKEVTKKLLQAENLPVARWLIATRNDIASYSFDNVVKQLGLPLFIKPANTGSSRGVSKVKTREQFLAAVELALQYDHKILMEEFIPCREIECSVLGNENPQVSLPGEIIYKDEFYTYHAKYFDVSLILETPAKLPVEISQQLQTLAIKTYQALGCEGMARIDFFVTTNYQIFINEANTIPGFTSVSMYPKNWEASGISYSALLDQLIHLALARFTHNQLLVSKKNTLHNIEETKTKIST